MDPDTTHNRTTVTNDRVPIATISHIPASADASVVIAEPNDACNYTVQMVQFWHESASLET